MSTVFSAYDISPAFLLPRGRNERITRGRHLLKQLKRPPGMVKSMNEKPGDAARRMRHAENKALLQSIVHDRGRRNRWRQ
jgi:hypothetical protein